MLVASGAIVTASAQGAYADLFSAVPNSLGSLGYLLRLRLRVQHTKPYVHITKRWLNSPEALVEAIEAACEPVRSWVTTLVLCWKECLIFCRTCFALPGSASQVEARQMQELSEIIVYYSSAS